MAEVYVTLGEAAELEGVKYKTMAQRLSRKKESFVTKTEKLINKYTQKKMEILRGIFDQSNVGIVIAGEPRLETELKGNLARFANRMDFYYKLKGLSKNEVVDYLEGYEVDEAAMGEMISRATNTQSGCFRLLDRTLNNVLRILKQKGETRITMKIVSEASNMMMSSRASLEAVGAAKVLKLAIRLREFSEEVREKGEHEYKLVDQYNYIKDILDA